MSRGTIFSYLTRRMFSPFNSLSITASGSTFWTSWADTPTHVCEASNPRETAFSFQVYVNPLSERTLSSALSNLVLFSFKVSSEEDP